ncbi:condensin complex subunit 3 isoform X2 [Dunckerocampus dactyliophorus]|uniref:condensin complex subunit 3 isoform X2 n=1 Tax=Dunckerocampus dactyliophorus TaxID=161453 RepID=UPI0024066C74|nr:condensin complex subunit 3 isoform X2 [Dunckerocampus dactyliophorus]
MAVDNEIDVKEAFQRAQKSHNNKAKLVASLKSRYNKLEDKTSFHEDFVSCLKHAMIVYKREPTVENVIEFAARFATSFQAPSKAEEEEEKGEEEEEEEDHPFLSFIFNFLLESHKASSHAVRFRVCQLINKLLGSMAENAQIDDDLFDRIHQAMLVRVTDKFPNVRIQAALAMTRLQQPSDPDCPTINAFMLILENDTNAEVRRAVLSCIAMSPRTLPKVLKRTRDVKENVRKLAYQVLADKVHVKALTIAQRVSLLEHGLHDTSAVKEVVCARLLPAWLLRLDGNVVELLHRLDVENCAQTALYMLKAIFKGMAADELLQNRMQLDNRKLIPMDSLTCENVLYWRGLCEFIKGKGDDGDEMLEQVLPDAATYPDYLYGYLQTVPVLSEEQRADLNQLELVMTKKFISQQLIHLISCLDTNEEGGRKRVLAVLQDMLAMPQTPSSLVFLLTEKLLTLMSDDHRRIQIVAEIISDLRAPITEASQPLDENASRRQQVQLAEVKVRILEAKQALEEFIAGQDFNRAAELKESITELEKEHKIIQESARPDDNEIRTEKNDPETLLRCLMMCAELLKQMNIKNRISPTISALMSSLILPSIASAHPTVRSMAVVCLGTCALHCKDFAKTHMVLLLQIAQLDDVKIRISALRAIVDLLLLFGFQLLSEPGSDQKSAERMEEDEEGDVAEDTAQSIVVMLSELLDNEVSELRTEAAEGLAKLMYTGRMSSAKMLSRLILLWYNPVTEDDIRLRHCLGVFFQLYSRESRAHQEVVEESFLPTVHTLLNAPATSPLAEVDVNNVVELLVELTRPSALMKPSTNTERAITACASEEVCVHDYLAVRICGEMLKDPTAPEVRLYAKTLNHLELSRDETVKKDLLSLMQQLVQVVKDRVCLRALEKMISYLVDSKQQAELLNATALQPLDVNADETAMECPSKSAKKDKRGQRKVCAAKGGRKASKRAESSEESDGENVPDSVPAVRPSRRAKTAALEKTKLDLNPLINQEANVS